MYGRNDCSAKCNNRGVRTLDPRHSQALWIYGSTTCVLWVGSLTGLQSWEQVSLRSWLGSTFLWCAAVRAASRYSTILTYTDSPLLPALLITMIYTWPLCSVFHWAAILGLNFSWALKQSCSVLMNTSRHWCSGISLLVCTYALIMLQRILLPEGGDVCCYLLILGQKNLIGLICCVIVCVYRVRPG